MTNPCSLPRPSRLGGAEPGAEVDWRACSCVAKPGPQGPTGGAEVTVKATIGGHDVVGTWLGAGCSEGKAKEAARPVGCLRARQESEPAWYRWDRVQTDLEKPG